MRQLDKLCDRIRAVDMQHPNSDRSAEAMKRDSWNTNPGVSHNEIVIIIAKAVNPYTAFPSPDLNEIALLKVTHVVVEAAAAVVVVLGNKELVFHVGLFPVVMRVSELSLSMVPVNVIQYRPSFSPPVDLRSSKRPANPPINVTVASEELNVPLILLRCSV